MIRSLKFISLITILLSIHNTAFTRERKAIDYEYNASKIHGFINHLISKEEFYRAYVELKRLNSYYPGYLKEEDSFVTELYLFFKGNKYSEILIKEYNGGNLNIEAVHAIFKTDVFLENSEFINAKAVLDSAGFSPVNKDVDFFLYKRTILSYILLKKIDEVRGIFDNRNINYIEFGFDDYKLNELIDYSESTYKSLKNPCNAILLGAIPGMGYVYSGQRATGIIAFLLISAISAATYYSFKTDNEPIGIFFGLATTFFYGGSIIGGYLGAKSFNKSVEKDLKDSLSLKMNLADDRKKIFNAYGVGSVGE